MGDMLKHILFADELEVVRCSWLKARIYYSVSSYSTAMKQMRIFNWHSTACWSGSTVGTPCQEVYICYRIGITMNQCPKKLAERQQSARINTVWSIFELHIFRSQWTKVKKQQVNRHWLPMLPFAPCPATLPSQPSPSSTWTWLPVPQRFRSDRSSSTETLKVSSNVKRWKRKGGIKVEGLCIQTR